MGPGGGASKSLERDTFEIFSFLVSSSHRRAGVNKPRPFRGRYLFTPTPGPNSSQEDCGSVLGGFASTFPCLAGRKKYGRGLRGCSGAAGSAEFLSCRDGRMLPFGTDA